MDIFDGHFDPGFFEHEEPTPVPVADEGPIGEEWDKGPKEPSWEDYATPLTIELQLSLLTKAEISLLNSQLDEVLPRMCE